jgi:hypothetical protein
MPNGQDTAKELRAASRRMRRNRISEAWTSHVVSVLRSPAWRVLSRAAGGSQTRARNFCLT